MFLISRYFIDIQDYFSFKHIAKDAQLLTNFITFLLVSDSGSAAIFNVALCKLADRATEIVAYKASYHGGGGECGAW